MGLEIIKLLLNLFSENCKEKNYPTVANPTGEKHLDKLIGIPDSFEKIKSGEIMDHYHEGSNWEKIINPFLLYCYFFIRS